MEDRRDVGGGDSVNRKRQGERREEQKRRNAGAKWNIGVMIKTLGMRTRGSRARGAQRNHKRGQERTPPEMSQ